jgi:hypothetical protein
MASLSVSGIVNYLSALCTSFWKTLASSPQPAAHPCALQASCCVTGRGLNVLPAAGLDELPAVVIPAIVRSVTRCACCLLCLDIDVGRWCLAVQCCLD